MKLALIQTTLFSLDFVVQFRVYQWKEADRRG